MEKTVGFVGLGIMGGAMAGNLVASGWRVVGYEIDSERHAALEAAGIELAPDIGTLARAAPVIVTSLPSASALRETARGLAEAKTGRLIVIETSTMALDDKLAAAAILGEAGHLAVDCPISGTGAQAKTRDLVIYASGDPAAIDSLRPLFADFTRAVHDVGPFGNGSRMKFVANLLVAIHNVASAEAMVLGMKAGLDPRQIVELVSAGAGTSRVFELRAPMMAEARYEPATMKSAVWQKDMSVIGAFARELGCPTPLLDATVPIYESGLREGFGAQDTASVCAILERMAGLDRSSPQE